MCRVGSLLVWLDIARYGTVLSRFGAGFVSRFGAGVEQGCFVVCVFTYHFGMLVVRCVWNPFFILLANQGAYFNSLLNIS